MRSLRRLRSRRLNGRYAYLWLDATFFKVRKGGRLVSMALVSATGVRERGERVVPGLDLGLSENRAFSLEFLHGLMAKGPHLRQSS